MFYVANSPILYFISHVFMWTRYIDMQVIVLIWAIGDTEVLSQITQDCWAHVILTGGSNDGPPVAWFGVGPPSLRRRNKATDEPTLGIRTKWANHWFRRLGQRVCRCWPNDESLLGQHLRLPLFSQRWDHVIFSVGANVASTWQNDVGSTTTADGLSVDPTLVHYRGVIWEALPGYIPHHIYR